MRLTEDVTVEGDFVLEAAGPSDRLPIQANGDGPHYLWVYQELFTRLGVRLLFTDFQQEVMTRCRVAMSDERSARGAATRGIRIDYAASKDGALLKDELSQELTTSSKIPSMGLGSFSQRVNARDDFGCDKKMGVAIVSVSKWD
ncbi:hypothetical protein PIB30_051665 [Stylosanthes scabra]|uniref:Uncharacterized protein n=1 Tax=Stylosanthes scabra TaxID=79078 RepID=A0ABU6QHE3_9FABA|nr:hypothetical protein [Stylosanthes scabra]